jgi:3-oxoacyl-[acyl-carrier-protein] synthase III
MVIDRLTPVVVGVGDIRNRSTKIEDAVEPIQLMLQAAQLAIKDTGLSSFAADELQSTIDSIFVVATWTWNYPDLPSLIGTKLGAQPRHKIISRHGGDSPAKLFDEAARSISLGESKIAIVIGGEALASRMYRKLFEKTC